jgi:xanthine dehydrogenase YagS FAD-binding subunit
MRRRLLKMESFELINPTSVKDAISYRLKFPDNSRFFAGGTNLLYLMKRRVRDPHYLINLKRIKELEFLSYDDKEGLRIGPLTTLEQLESSEIIQKKSRILSQAARRIASPQIRYMATVGGNLCQEVWCWYLLEDFPCWLNGGKYCFAPQGDNRYHHSVLGGYLCFAVHPSDLATALCALDATVMITGKEGTREVQLENFLPGFSMVEDKLQPNTLKSDEVLTEVRVKHDWLNAEGVFIKFATRQSFDFALASTAVTFKMEDAVCKDVRIIIGGIGPHPFRSRRAEEMLRDNKPTTDILAKAVENLFERTIPLSGNEYRIQISKDLVRRALAQLSSPDKSKFIPV